MLPQEGWKLQATVKGQHFLSSTKRLCFRRKSLWGKRHGKEERTTKEGQGSLSCCTWCPKSHSASHREGRDLHIAHGVSKH